MIKKKLFVLINCLPVKHEVGSFVLMKSVPQSRSPQNVPSINK